MVPYFEEISSGEVRKVSREDIQLVQNLIEQCLQRYMSPKEVVNTLFVQKKIEPGFTELVWEKLVEENQEFFKAYHLRLLVKDQIMQFNRLLERQIELIRQIAPDGVASTPTSNGSHVPPLHQSSGCYASEHTGPVLKAENSCSSVANTFCNGGSSLHSGMQNAVDVSANARMIDLSRGMLQSSNAGTIGVNGGRINTVAGYAGSSQYMFGTDSNVLEAHPAIADAAVCSFSSVESNSQPPTETLPDVDASSGFLGQIPRWFSLSDLTADFSHSSDTLVSHSRSPFLVADRDFMDPHGSGEHLGDNKRLDTISEGLSYEDFGSD